MLTAPAFHLLALLAASFTLTGSALGAVTVTPASGGGSISADTAANAAAPAWTSLGSIVIAEPSNSKGDIGGGTLILKAPAGFQFNSAATPSLTFSAGQDITAASIAVTDPTTLTVTLTVSGSSARDTLTIGGTTPVQVRPIAGTPLPSGNIYRPTSGGGTAVINGVTATANTSGSGGTSFGALKEVVGTARQLALQTAPSAAVTAGAVFSPQPVLLVQDQFGTTRNTANGVADNTTVVNAARGVGSGALQGTTNVTAANGVATFANLFHAKAETITVVFSSGSLTSVVSGSILVSAGAGNRLVFTTQPGNATYGTLLNPQPVVQSRDAFGNDSTLSLPASKIVTLAVTAGTGTLLGTQSLDIGTGAGNGTIVFTNLQASAAGSGKQLTASATGMTNGVSSSFTVSPVTVTGSITASNKLYDGTMAASIATRTLTGVLGSDQVTLTGGSATFASKNVGGGQLVTATGLTLGGAQAANYQLASTTATTTADITPAPLTVRADNLARTYGATNPPLTASYTGFVGGETLATSGVTGSPGLSTTAQTNSPAGAYPINATLGTLAAQNYSLSTTNGVLTVAKAPLTVAANNLWRVYGATNPGLTVSYSSFVLGQDTSVLSGSPSVTTTAVTNSPVGSYTIVVAAGSLTSPNYAFTFVNGTLSVVPAGTLFMDSFTRSTDPGPLSPWVAQAGNWSVTGGALASGTNVPYSYSYLYLTNVWTNYSAQAQIRLSAGAFGGGLATRLNPATGTRYAAWIYPGGSPGGSNMLKLLKFQNWTGFTAVQQASLPGVGTNWHTLRLVAQGNRLAAHYDGSLVLSWTDPDAQPFLSGGVSLEMWNDATAYRLSADDVLVALPVVVVASNDTYTVRQGSTLTVSSPGVLGNDTPEMGSLTALPNTGPTHGTLDLSTNGGFTYTPVVSYAGTDTFTYRAYDGFSTSSVATVTISITTNRAPVAANDSYSLMANTTLTVPAPGVLTNDSDADGDSLTVVLATAPTKGALSLSPNGAFTYIPSANYVGSDSFTYRASDGQTNSALATVSISVTAFTPLYSDTFTRTSLSPWVMQAGNWAISSGVLKGGTNASASYGYAYLTNQWGDYSVQARLQLSAGGFGGALAGRLNQATGARYAAWIYPEGSPGGSSVLKLLKFQNWSQFTVLQQATLPGVGTNWHTLKLVMQGSRIAVHYDGTLMLSLTDTYAPPLVGGGVSLELWTEATPWTLSADDVAVNAVRNVLATNDTYTVRMAGTLTVPAPGVLTNDAGEMGSLTAVLATNVAHGTLILNPSGGFTYVPVSTYSGSDTFAYQATDGVNTSSPATVTITVPANRGPTATNDSYTLTMNSTLTLTAPGVLANDTDLDGDPLTAVLASSPAHGTLSLSDNGGFSYAPTIGYTGSDSFTYWANDGATNSTAATVTLSVTAPGVLLTDNFARTTLSPWVVQAGNWAVTNGVLRGGTNSTFTYGYAYLTNNWTDCEAQARIRLPLGAYGGGLAGRLNRVTGARYAAWIYPEGSPGGSTSWKLLKFQNWTTFTLIQQGTLPGVGTNWHTLKLVFQGNRIDFYYDSTALTSVKDAQPYLSGGISVDLWTDAASYVLSADDVQVTALAPDVSVAAVGMVPNLVNQTVAVTFQGAPGGLYLVQATTDLGPAASWTPVSTNLAGGDGRWTFTDSLTSSPRRWYRAVRP